MAYFGQTFLLLMCAGFVFPAENESTLSTYENTSPPSYAENFDEQLPNFDKPQCEKSGNEIDLKFSNVSLKKVNKHFTASPFVTCLNLDNNGITEISVAAFERLPNLRFLDLSGNKIDQVDLFHFSKNENLKTLVLDDVFLPMNTSASSYYEMLPFPFPNLESLYLRKNHLRIYSHILLSLPRNLTNLHLSGNEFGSTFDITFDRFPRTLTHLSLDGNSIKWLLLRRNSPLNNLVYMNLNNNEFQHVCGSCYYFSSTLRVEEKNESSFGQKLRYLLLSGNKIMDVRKDSFNSIPGLIHLDLSHNEISFLSQEVFTPLTQLRVLNVSDNFLRKIPLFPSNLNLKNINLRNNQIQMIENDALSNVSSLEYLDLSGNMLRYLPEDWTLLRMNLRVLLLKDNLFTNLENFHLMKTTSLTDLHVAGNPITRVTKVMFNDIPANISVHFQHQEYQSDSHFNLQSKQTTGYDFEVTSTTTSDYS